MPWFLDTTVFGRAIVFQQARTQTQARTAGHYPAPIAALHVLQHGLSRSVEDSLAMEAEWVSDLVVGTECKNLVRIFLLSERAKKESVVADRSIQPVPVRSLGLVGAGVMGGGIGELASRFGIDVRMRDLQLLALTRALETARSLIDERGRKKRSPARERDGQMAHILPTLELSGMRRVDAAIEAVVEDLDVKRRVFAELEVRMRPTLLADEHLVAVINALADGLAHRSASAASTSPTPSTDLRSSKWCAARRRPTRRSSPPSDSRGGSEKTPVVVNDRQGSW
jgi:3-hydroxyacyl-CoA dehydrogenase/enoyl-CoA hydratase/3-hydroxybutyryl-CoA epimerase